MWSQQSHYLRLSPHRLTFYVALRQTPFEFIPEKWRYKPAILVSQDGCTCARLITEILMNPLFWSCQVVKWKSFNALFPSYRPFYEGSAGFAAVPVNFFSLSEDDKALTLGEWGMRKRDENSGKIKDTAEKKENAGKDSLQAQRNDSTIQPLYAWSRFFFLFSSIWVKGGTWEEVPVSKDRWHSDHHSLGGPGEEPATPHAWLGYQALNKCNSLHQACRGSFPAIIRLMRTLIPPLSNYTKKNSSCLRTMKGR